MKCGTGHSCPVPHYDYLCKAGHLTDTFRPMSDAEIDCPHCDLVAVRQFGVPNIVGPTTDTRGMFRRFSEASQEIEHTENKTGRLAAPRNMWQQAKKIANARIRARETN